MVRFAIVSAVLLAGCTLTPGTGVGGGGISSSPDGGVSNPPPPDGFFDEDGGFFDPDGGVVGQPQLAAEEQWAACVAVSSAELSQVMGTTLAAQASAEGRCDSCHGEGGGNVFLNIDAAKTAHAWATQAAVESAYVPHPIVGADGTFFYRMGVATDKICGAGTEAMFGNDAGVGPHPAFDCNALVGGVQPMTALENFRKLVQAKLDAGECPTPGFAAP
jgi:hypothetical protein